MPFNPNQPRDKEGQWAGGGSMPRDLTGNSRPLAIKPATVTPEFESISDKLKEGTTTQEAGSNAVAAGLAGTVNYGKAINAKTANTINRVVADLSDRTGDKYASITALPEDQYRQVFKLKDDLSHSPAGVKHIAGVRHLVLNEAMWSDKSRMDGWLSAQEGGNLTDATRSGILAHEHGHLVSENKISSDVQRRIYKAYNESGDYISGRSFVDEKELMAEAFAHHAAGKPLPPSLQELKPYFTR
jgi:hypothetical protein